MCNANEILGLSALRITGDFLLLTTDISKALLVLGGNIGYAMTKCAVDC